MIDNTSLYKTPEGCAAVMTYYDSMLARWPVPIEARCVETRHGATHVIICGREDAPPLLIFHGWGGNAAGAFNEYDVRLLGQHFRLYFPDTIGQTGRSASTRPPTDGDAYGEWAADLFDALGIQQGYVAGISGGGYLTLKTASYIPSRILKALAISSAGLVSLQKKLPLRFAFGAVPAMLFPNNTTARLFVRNASSPKVEFSPKHADMADAMALLFRHHRFTRGPDSLTDGELRRITAPVYLLMGGYDNAVFPRESLERAQRLIANVQTELVPDAGHVLTLDAPGLAEARMLAFFNAA